MHEDSSDIPARPTHALLYKNTMLKKTRRLLAAIAFACTTLLFLDITGTIHTWFGWMAKIQFLPALLALNVIVVAVLLLLTLIMGRIYCSVICPLGIFQDGVAHLGTRRKRNPYSHSPEKKWLRYAVLVVFAAALLTGTAQIVALLDPYSAYGRMAANMLQPIYIFFNNMLAAIATHMDSYAFYGREVWMRGLPTLAVAIATMLIVALPAMKGGRTYCNTICPVGTMLSFLARFSWFKICFDADKCKQCSLCEKNCKAACIDFKNLAVDYSRCVTCGNCLTYCKHDALHYTHPTADMMARTQRRRQELLQKRADTEARKATVQESTAETENHTAASTNQHTVDTSRRHFLLGTVMATSAAAMAQVEQKVDGGLAEIEDKVTPQRATELVPPGALSAMNMAKHCTACQLCVAQCPNDVLRPSARLQHFMQPYMNYNRGFCRPECTRCSEVCPTGAIRKIDKAEKSSIRIGHAVWVKKNCVVLTDEVECGNCARHCPTGAIEMIDFQAPHGTVKVPSVNWATCIGCGACEHLCPARPFTAIYVEGHEMHQII